MNIMNTMQIFFLITFTRFIRFFSTLLHLGVGGTWPGEIALRVEPKILSYLASQLDQIVLITGTNGKTTTAKMVEHIFGRGAKLNHPEGGLAWHVVHNESGANLLNGITSVLIQATDFFGRLKTGIGVFEVDEATLPLALKELTPTVVVLLNLFRDQLDRYGEVDIVADKWLRSLKSLAKDITIIINADDPHLAYIGSQLSVNVKYFGIGDKNFFLKQTPHAVDTVYCPECGKRLRFESFYLSHLGEWKCTSCGLSHPKNDIQKRNIQSPLPGLYNLYNTMAAVLTIQEICRISSIRLDKNNIIDTLLSFSPAFGRQEQFKVDGKKVKIFLSKNPAGFNASLSTVLELNPKILLLVLNDRIPDGRDVSWIWDVDFETIPEDVEVIVSGDRVYDMAVRIKYALENQKYKSKIKYFEDIKNAINEGLDILKKGETLYILPTYSAMLEVRKILSGRKIL